MAVNPIHPTTEYAQKVLAGKILACRWVTLACQRHLDDLKKHGTKKKAGLWFDEASANDIINFFEGYLFFYEGEFDGRHFILELWQKFLIGSLFGWKRGNFRRFRTAYVEIAKGNGKSPMAAGIGLYGMLLDNEPGAEIYAAATMREQAGILFRDAKAFAEGSPSLRKKFSVGVANIDYHDKNSYFRPVSSEHRGLDGKRPHIALIDEIHEHPNSMVVDKMRAGTKGRRQALIFEITNAGYDRQSVCYQHHEYSEKILQGVIENDAWFAFMTGLDVCEKCAAEGKTIPTEGCPDCDDWTTEKAWIKANPNLGVSIQKSYLKEQVDEAKDIPAKQNIVKRLNFCIWTESETRWISLDRWNTCNIPVSPDSLKGRLCFGGLDLSSTTDITAWVKVFPPAAGESRYQAVCRFFIPEDNMWDRIRRDRVPYDVWVRDGWVIPTPGNVIDYAFILAEIAKDMKAYDLAELAFDRWGSTKIITDLQDMGFEEKSSKHAQRHLIDFGQGFASMSSPTKELEKMILSQEIAHGGNPVLTWMASNVVVRTDPAGNVKPDKEKSIEKIDGIVALIMAISRAVTVGDTASVYESEGIKTLNF